MNILLTGANGQLGREVLERAQATQVQVFPHTRSQLDITHLDQLDQAVATLRPSILINTAAYTAVDRAEQEAKQAFAINRDGVKNLAQVCKRYNVPLIHISTDYVFDGSKKSPYLEEDPRAPVNVYGASKAEGEIILQNEWEKHLILRTSWVFGKHGANFVKTVLRLALRQPEVKIVADQRGCPTAAHDLAFVLLKLAQKINQGQESWGVYHYSGSHSTTWHAFAERIVGLGNAYFPFKLEKLHAISTAEYPTPAKRPANSVLSSAKIEKEFGILPPDWEQALIPVIKHIHEIGELREYISS